MWLGPTTAGYFLVRGVMGDRAAGRPLPRAAEIWAWRRFEILLCIEHVAFVALVATGLLRLHAIGLSPIAVMTGDPLWLRLKLWIALLVLVPLEAHDVWLSHVKLPALLRRLEAGDDDVALLLAPHARFLARGVWLFAVLVPLYFYLAVWRP